MVRISLVLWLDFYDQLHQQPFLTHLYLEQLLDLLWVYSDKNTAQDDQEDLGLRHQQIVRACQRLDALPLYVQRLAHTWIQTGCSLVLRWLVTT